MNNIKSSSSNTSRKKQRNRPLHTITLCSRTQHILHIICIGFFHFVYYYCCYYYYIFDAIDFGVNAITFCFIAFFCYFRSRSLGRGASNFRFWCRHTLHNQLYIYYISSLLRFIKRMNVYLCCLFSFSLSLTLLLSSFHCIIQLCIDIGRLVVCLSPICPILLQFHLFSRSLYAVTQIYVIPIEKRNMYNSVFVSSIPYTHTNITHKSRKFDDDDDASKCLKRVAWLLTTHTHHYICSRWCHISESWRW